MNKLGILLTLLAAALPSAAFAAPRAGTTDYLRDILKLPDERFTQELNTEERKPFAFATIAGDGQGPVKGAVEDPVGDVLDRKGMEPKFSAPWGDLTAASLEMDHIDGLWIVTWTLAEPFPQDDPDHKIEWVFYADAKGDAADNSPSEGVRGDMDNEWSLKRDDKGAWSTAIRWYNKSADFWALDRKTEATFAFEDNRIVLRIPFIELPKESATHWRVVAAVADAKNETQIDVAPGIGFPPSRTSAEETLTKEPSILSKLFPAMIVLGIAALVTLAYVLGLRFARRRKA